MKAVDSKFVRLNRTLAVVSVVVAVAFVAVQGPASFRKRFGTGPKDRTLQSHLEAAIEAVEKSSSLDVLQDAVESTCDVTVSRTPGGPDREPKDGWTFLAMSTDASLLVTADRRLQIASASFDNFGNGVAGVAAVAGLPRGSPFNLRAVDLSGIQTLRVAKNEDHETKITLTTQRDVDGKFAMLIAVAGVVTRVFEYDTPSDGK